MPHVTAIAHVQQLLCTPRMTSRQWYLQQATNSERETNIAGNTTKIEKWGIEKGCIENIKKYENKGSKNNFEGDFLFFFSLFIFVFSSSLQNKKSKRGYTYLRAGEDGALFCSVQIGARWGFESFEAADKRMGHRAVVEIGRAHV